MCPLNSISASAASLLKETQTDGLLQQQVGPKCCHVSTLEVQTFQSWQPEAKQTAQQKVLPYAFSHAVSCLLLRGQTADQMQSNC